MDATEQFLRQQEVQVPQKYVVAGYSKVHVTYCLKKDLIISHKSFTFSVDGQVRFVLFYRSVYNMNILFEQHGLQQV